MKKVFFGGLKNHWKDYILVLICGIFMVTIIFLSNSLSDCLQWIIDGQITGNAEESYSFFDFSITYLLLVFMMILIIFSYIRKRSYDYVLLDVMGIQKRHKYIFIGCEYLGLVVISILGGILFGAILSEIIKIELEKIFANIIFTEINYGFSPFRMTIIIGFCVFGLLFIVFDEAISCLGMDSLLSCGKKSGKPVKTRPKVFILGMTFMFLAYISLWFYWGKVSKGIPLILLSIGILLGMISIGAYYLCYLRKKENKYYKKITWLDNWYHRFFYNINMSFIITEFIIVTLYGFSIVIFDNIPVNEPQNYPYDVVWMASDKDIAFIDELKQKYEIKVKKQPCIRVTTNLEVVIRVNIQKENIKYVPEFVDSLKQVGIDKRNNIKPYFSLVRDYEIDKGYIYSSCFSVPEFSEEESKLRQILLKKGFQPANSNIQPKLYGCGAVSPNSILVEPDGTLQKCWNVVGDKNEAIGNIMDIGDEFNGTLQELINESKWYAWSEFENEDCKNCEVLPLCMGGCPYYAVKLLYDKTFHTEEIKLLYLKQFHY